MQKAEYEQDYWADRGGLGDHHFWQAINWLYHYDVEKNKPVKTALDYGCGRGEYVHALRSLGVEAQGYEISKAAVEQSFGLAAGHTSNTLSSAKFDLTVCFDVLEHCNVEEARTVIKDLRQRTKSFALFSICMYNELGKDPNFEKDKTHKLLRTKDWWKNELRKGGFKVVEAPEYFLYWPQLILCEVETA